MKFRMWTLPMVAMLFLSSPSFSLATDNVTDNVVSQKMSIYKDQQMNYINAMLDCVREDMRIYREREGLVKEMSINTTSEAIANPRGSRYPTKYQQTRDRLQGKSAMLTIKEKENEDRLRDLEIKKGDLKLKVVETTGGVPIWWEENEAYYLRERKRLRSP